MSSPKPINVQTINALATDPHNYESHKQTILKVNQIIANLGPGEAIKPQNFSLGNGFGTGASISSLSGTFKRGAFVISMGAGGFAPNPAVTLNFPPKDFDNPSAIVVRNGGNGTLPFSYTMTASALTITLQGTGIAAQTYGFQFDVRD